MTDGSDTRPASDIATRKIDHLDIVLRQDAEPGASATGLDRIVFEHVALPEISLADIDLSVPFLGRRLAAPLLISSMTGGPDRASRINRHLAEAAEHLKIALGVGSQRVAIEGRGGGGLDRRLRDLAPSVPLLANIGGAQFVLGYGEDEAMRAVEMIGADALIVHLNPLQEAVQTGGDTDWRGVLSAIASLCSRLRVPVVVKEVGAGISPGAARRLVEAGVAAIDVAGAGGTSWAGVEAERAGDARRAAIARQFAGWGIPTARAIAEVRVACPTVPLIGSGGIRTGLDVARAIRLGADIAGQAAATLEAAETSGEAVVAHFEDVIETLRIACFCTGSASVADLRRARLIDPPDFAL
ncbi:type 2 isopentenyl-diphosphate Delta-isomerase [Fulvimarina endophytica]|uniref:Isopentenyl-diphosphate delta-isomerase n=1 Tax=Fulvimarina endophytica TaxID=2293836 RepID=A0A371X5S7_9HYPH|nr:type 2 isopentenyl-diphosphate Delta-isomerase [Fulvimarina endophytica]RFC64581.1 type 2 isopentenyl-diphosphate Delta-isomerase [Fulvimarina endophytica]